MTQPLTPEREAEIRALTKRLGLRIDRHDEFEALYALLAEIDRLRAELLAVEESATRTRLAGMGQDASRADALAEGLTVPEHQLLTYALELVKEQVAERGTELDADNAAALDSLCRLADAFAERKASR